MYSDITINVLVCGSLYVFSKLFCDFEAAKFEFEGGALQPQSYSLPASKSHCNPP